MKANEHTVARKSPIRCLSSIRTSGWIGTPAAIAHRSSFMQYRRRKKALSAGSL